jgi:hypothetical protein
VNESGGPHLIKTLMSELQKIARDFAAGGVAEPHEKNARRYGRRAFVAGQEGEEAVNIGPAFWVIMAVGGAVLIGVALTYGVISRRGRRVEKSDSAKEK